MIDASERGRPFAPIRGLDPWCVPTALSALTGLDTDLIRCLALGLSCDRESRWRGVPVPTILSILDELGIGRREREVDLVKTANGRIDRESAWTWASCGRRTGHRKGLHLIVASNHAMLYRGGWIVDNGVVASKQPTRFRDVRKLRRQRMETSIEIPDRPYHECELHPPTWAQLASRTLDAVRDRSGRQARISGAWIRSLVWKPVSAAELRLAPQQYDEWIQGLAGMQS